MFTLIFDSMKRKPAATDIPVRTLDLGADTPPAEDDDLPMGLDIGTKPHRTLRCDSVNKTRVNVTRIQTR